MPAAAASATRGDVTARPSRRTCATATSPPKRPGATTGWSETMAQTATARISVDVGGTFTDFVLHDPARDLVATGKRLTTPEDPSEAILAGVQRLLQETG